MCDSLGVHVCPQHTLDHAGTEVFFELFLGGFLSSLSSLPYPLLVGCLFLGFILFCFLGLVGSSLALQVVWNS